MKNKIIHLTFLLAFVSVAFSCSKAERATVEEEPVAVEEALTVEETVDILTKAVTKEDLEDVSLLLKLGEADESVYLKIDKESTTYVEGEVSLVAGDNYKKVGLDLVLMGSITLKGDVDVIPLAAALAKSLLYTRDIEKFTACLDEANLYINVQMMDSYAVMVMPVLDEESLRYGFDVVLSDGEGDPVSITMLLGMMGIIG